MITATLKKWQEGLLAKTDFMMGESKMIEFTAQELEKFKMSKMREVKFCLERPEYTSYSTESTIKLNDLVEYIGREHEQKECIFCHKKIKDIKCATFPLTIGNKFNHVCKNCLWNMSVNSREALRKYIPGEYCIY